jgi:hypothetical protein
LTLFFELPFTTLDSSILTLKMRGLFTFAIASASTALAAQLAKATVSTQDNVYDPQGYSARPTPPPSFDLVKRKLKENAHLVKRDTLSSGELIGYFGPDNTCGYVNGQLGMSCACIRILRALTSRLQVLCSLALLASTPVQRLRLCLDKPV